MTKQMIEQGIDFQFVDATVGKNIKEFCNCINSRSFNYLTAGSVGCWISHFRVWQKIAACRSGCFVVLEDDVTLFDKFKINISELLNNKIGDFDILLLATGNNYKRNKRFYINNELFVPYQLRNGAYSYILTPEGAQKLINLIPSVQVTRGGIDSAIGVLIRNNKLVSYHLEVPLCRVNYKFGSSTKKQSK